MGYAATVLNVMIASPSDVPQERVVVRDVIAEWNAVHARDRRFVLLPIAWETHATPDTGNRPQAIINAQLLKDADLLVAIFWTRLGSPTGEAASGTVEEIEEHIKAGKPAMIYFSSAPAHPDSIISEQYAALKKFKESLASRGLYWDYETLSDFKDKLSRHLAQTIISKFSGDDSEDARPSGPANGIPFEISDAARELLVAASKDDKGAIMNLQALDGSTVQTNGRNFVERGDPRSEATWRGAVAELDRLGLIEDRRGKGEVYFVTGKGYQTADLLK